MKNVILSILLLSPYAYVAAKNIKGKVVDPDSHPIEFANVSAFANDSIIGGCVTDSTGCFALTVLDECNRIRVSYIGLADALLSPDDGLSTDDSLSPDDGDLGIIMLQQASTALKEVAVTAPLIRREADRLVLNVAANPLSANKDAHELLKTAPGVWATDNSLSIYGQEGATVYIDDRKVNMTGTQLTTYLRSIQSSSIASIEIIPKAGAEFSASSSGGVIRINLKHSRVDGMVGAAGLNTTFGEYKTWINPFANISLHSGNWTANLSGNMNGSPSDRYTSHEDSENSNSGLSLAGVSRHKTKTLQGNVMFGIFYQPDGKDKISLQIDYNPDSNNANVSSRTRMASDMIDATTMGAYRSEYRFHNLNIALNYSHLLDCEGSALKWNSNYNFQSSSTYEDNRMQWLPLGKDSIYSTDNTNRYNIFDTEVSLQKNFKPGWKLNAGLKYTHNDVGYDSRHFIFINNQWTGNPAFDYDSKYREDIVAAYATFNAQAGRWRFKAGLRGEYYHTSGIESGQSEFDLFPNANVAFNLTERGDYTVALGYYRNISRPSFWSLNPAVRQVSDYSYSVGNPTLRPSHVDAVSLDFVLAGRFTVAAGYSATSNPIRQMFVSNHAHPERMYLTWNNTGKDNSGFIHGGGFISITRWWNLYASLTYAVTSRQLDINSGFDTFGYLQATASTTFILPHSFNITLNGFYQTQMKVGNITVYPILNLNPTLQKRFGQQWSVSVGFENLLQRKGKIRAVSAGYDRLTYTRQYMAVRLGISYNFNSGKTFRTPPIEKNTDRSRLQKE